MQNCVPAQSIAAMVTQSVNFFFVWHAMRNYSGWYAVAITNSVRSINFRLHVPYFNMQQCFNSVKKDL